MNLKANKNKLASEDFYDNTVSRQSTSTTTKEAEKPATALKDETKKLPLDFKVLLVEDEPMVQKVNKIMLEMMGYSVDIVGTGEQAIQKFQNAYDYDCVLLDIALPGISGLEVSKAIRQQFGNEQIPIIALTAFSHQALRGECIAAGINEIVLKPANFDDLKQILSRLS